MKIIGSVILLFLLTGSGAFAQPVVAARPQGNWHIALRSDIAVVRESWRANLAGKSTVCRFAEIPVSVDPASIFLAGRKSGLSLLEWKGVSNPTASPTDDISVSGRSVRLDLNRETQPVSREHEAVIASPIAGDVLFDLIYLLPGIEWSVRYDVLVRGELADFSVNLSVDVEGRLQLVNHSGRAMSNVVLSLVMPDTSGKSPPQELPGILELEDDSPLSDLWRYPQPDEKVPHLYSLPGRHGLPPGRSVSVSHVSVQRKAVERELHLAAEDIPTDARSATARPRLRIKMQNESDFGRGKAVPPGPVSVYLGSQQSTVYKTGWFNHTPAGGTIEVDLGEMEGVSVRRIKGARTERVGGGYEQVYELRIENRLGRDVLLVVDERPPVEIEWILLRSSEIADQQGQRIYFRPTIPSSSQLIIQYAIRVDSSTS